MQRNPTVIVPFKYSSEDISRIHNNRPELRMLTEQSTVLNFEIKQNEFEYAQQKGLFSKEFVGDFDKIITLDDYAKSASFNVTKKAGKIYKHHFNICGLCYSTSKMSIYSECIHNELGGIPQCIERLTNVLHGNTLDFVLFLRNQLCNECILHFLSTVDINTLLKEYCIGHKTIFSRDESRYARCKELMYFSNCVLKYHSVIRYIIHDFKLCEQLFHLLLYYFKQFPRIKPHFKSKIPFVHSMTEHGYVLYGEGLSILSGFEYNLIGIVSCIREIMPHLKPTHLRTIINMNYFGHFKKFMDQYLELEYIQIIAASIKPTGNDTTLCVPVELLFSVNEFLLEFVYRTFNMDSLSMKHVNLNRIGSKSYEMKLVDIARQVLRTEFFCRKVLSLCFDKNERLRKQHVYEYMCCSIAVRNIHAKQTIFMNKKELKRKHKRCWYCAKRVKHLKLCTQCKLSYYCDVKCQKQDWQRHKIRCRLIFKR